MALAQSSTSSAPSSTVSIYLPFGGDSLQASVITAAPSATVYAIGCEIVSDACAPGCSLDSSVTVTEGESTLRYTWTDGQRAIAAATGSSLIHDVTTVACSLYGGTRATSAVCTGYSAAEGLGNGTQTTTLASSQISYLPVTVTASMDGMPAATGSGTHTATGPSSSSSGAAAASTNAGTATTATRYGAFLVAIIGALALI